MTQCEQGYLCDICGDEVASITESDLYLRYVIGEIQVEALSQAPERHIRCNPITGQFIVDEAFEPLIVEGAFDKRRLDPDYVQQQEAIITEGWRRLQTVAGTNLPISEYPLKTTRS